ncbi:TIGR03086 family metal-binding protein [Kitasatospora purpeofusca]|uniref:TIGR03086 family metal-binding protein n=1 Tax=Kitasatospora purpeofusca TaxID=67352 RepID=UPI002E1315B6|nr:TIGR03086 family metal-binding protein [Kitasatospora purpeofusca]
MACHHGGGEHAHVLAAHKDITSVLGQLVRAVGPAGWTRPTPCSEWNVRHLVNHVTAELLWVAPLMLGGTPASVGRRFDGDVLGRNPVGMWYLAADTAVPAFSRAGALDRLVHLTYGTRDALGYCRELTAELTVHTWDLARALGGAWDSPSATTVALAMDEFRSYRHLPESGRFAAPSPVDPQADALTRLAALAGRDPNWLVAHG